MTHVLDKGTVRLWWFYGKTWNSVFSHWKRKGDDGKKRVPYTDDVPSQSLLHDTFGVLAKMELTPTQRADAFKIERKSQHVICEILQARDESNSVDEFAQPVSSDDELLPEPADV